MATQKQREAARKNVKKAQARASEKRTITKLSKQMGKAQLIRAVGHGRRSRSS
jgi:hypothetical protein